MNGRSTPSQTVGPFFGIGFSWLERADLTEGAKTAEGFTIRGRVLDGDGVPVPDAVLEIWQADEEGRYAHPEDRAEGTTGRRFFGFGRIPVNDQGEFRFATIKPGAIPGPKGAVQAPHLVVSIFMRGLLKRLITRIYFPNNPANEADTALVRVPPERRHTLVAKPDSHDKKTLVWDVHLQGHEETVFFEC